MVGRQPHIGLLGRDDSTLSAAGVVIMLRLFLRAPAGWVIAVISLAVMQATTTAKADTLDDIRQRGVLIWGGDAEGGGPFVFPRNDDPTR
jgi:hypothetical protein